MNRVFVSYTGHRIERAKIVHALREHGINPWRDADNLNLGDATTDTILAELVDCSGLVLWINRDLFDSEYVRRVELPAIDRAARTRPLRIVPVFDGLSPGEGSELVSRMGYEIGDNHGHVVDPRAAPSTTAAAIAAEYVRGHVHNAYTAGTDPVVRMVTYDDTAALREGAVLNFDWRHHVAEGTITEDVEGRLRSALAASTGALKSAYGTCEVTVAVKAHLSLAVALGHAFSQPTGCTLRLHRPDGDWTVPAEQAGVPVLCETTGGLGPVDAGGAAIGVSVTRDVNAGLTEHVAQGNRYRHRIILSPETGPGRTTVDSSATANAWARQVADVLTATADRHDVDHIALYLATPVELAVMIGWWANATGRTKLMDWAKTGPYRRLWEIL